MKTQTLAGQAKESLIGRCVPHDLEPAFTMASEAKFHGVTEWWARQGAHTCGRFEKGFGHVRPTAAFYIFQDSSALACIAYDAGEGEEPVAELHVSPALEDFFSPDVLLESFNERFGEEWEEV